MAELDSKATLDDIVFANRNQAYGAYDLRKSYPKTVTRALIIGGILFTLGVLDTNDYNRSNSGENQNRQW